MDTTGDTPSSPSVDAGIAILNGAGFFLVVSYFDDCKPDPYARKPAYVVLTSTLPLSSRSKASASSQVTCSSASPDPVSPDEPLMVYVLTAALTAIDVTTSLGPDLAFAGLMQPGFDRPNWRIPGIHARPSFEATHGYSEGEIERVVTEAVPSDTLRYLATLLDLSRATGDMSADTLGLGEITSPKWNLAARQDSSPPIDPRFYQYLLQEVDILVVAFVTNLSPIVCRIRHADEDTGHVLNISTTRSRQPGPHSRAVSYANQPPPAASRSLPQPPEAASPSFSTDFVCATEARVPALLRPLYNMFGSLACGQGCATYAYNFLSTNGGQYKSGSASAGA
ncbi:hypothetical protein FRC06_004085, partial [Ceratobasidium sp. 370]